tara:strand:+ start:1310 stop:1720 length:411 start_codon:yes stop_codon:yes gene_type:complete
MNYTERLQLEADTFAQQLTQDYPLADVTTKIQKKNGTRMFKLGGSLFATYESGMVRKVIRIGSKESSCYQLNPTRIGKRYFMKADLTVNSYPAKSRVLIYNDKSRLEYLKRYLIKNYNMLPLQDIIVVDGIKYKRI